MDVKSTTEKIVLAQLKTQMNDNGYIVRVFECLEEYYNNSKYIMCTQFPNWNQKKINIGDIGYLKVREIIAGLTGWYDPEEDRLVQYNYDTIQFIRFVSAKDANAEKEVIELYDDGVIPTVSRLEDIDSED